jgi:5'-nucleotidase/UDP-sugar diphosphatase
MRSSRSLRILTDCTRLGVCAVAALGVATACGGTAAPPTPASAPTTAAAPPPAAAASPQRPPLASVVASPASPSATPAASTVAGAEQTYEVQSGDTLLTIAEKFYDDATKWRRIYDANKDVIGSDPDKLKLEMKLKIPPKE